MEIDASRVFRTLDNLERQLTSSQHKSAVVKATRKGGNILKADIKNQIPKKGGFEHIPLLKRSVKVVASRAWRKWPGVNVLIKGPDVPVGQGNTRRFWKLASYAYLVFFGNYNSPKRNKDGRNRGNVSGVVNRNPFVQSMELHGKNVLAVSVRHLLDEVRKQIAKSVR